MTIAALLLAALVMWALEGGNSGPRRPDNGNDGS